MKPCIVSKSVDHRDHAQYAVGKVQDGAEEYLEAFREHSEIFTEPSRPGRVLGFETNETGGDIDSWVEKFQRLWLHGENSIQGGCNVRASSPRVSFR